MTAKWDAWSGIGDIPTNVWKPDRDTRSENTSTSNDEDDILSDPQPSDEPQLHDVKIPTSSPGLVTQRYQQALANRIDERLLSEAKEYDIQDFVPTIVHDIMMLPGSLAALLLKDSLDLPNRMTPALLPGVEARVIPDTLQPCLLRCPNQETYTPAMLIFGLGREARKLIHRHYQPHAKRKKIQVEIDVKIRIFDKGGKTDWKPERRVLWAHAWFCSPGKNGKRAHKVIEGATWTLEKYLEGKLEPRQTLLRISSDGKGEEDEDGFIGRDVREKVFEPEVRETVHSSGGGVEYERAGTLEW